MKKFDLEAFKAFVRAKPADVEYNPYHCDQCALGLFGFPVRGWRISDINRAGVPVAVFEAATQGAKTFGALAIRLDALQ